MKGLDTNVLVRYLTQDDPQQARAANAVIARAVEESSRLRVDDVVVCEVVWVLRHAYRFDRRTISSTLDKVLSTGLFAFEDRERLRQALDDYRGSRGDFADYVIGRRNLSSGCESTVTFDRDLESSPAFTLL
ncbi:MAG TPA: type II toxin-antitoxin system VapC family toxin [Thermoanaerobaculia bacterium]|nr:type II toxin-antitoxin system VapC family toxin [Thermoanaerobaculia bacterium]